MTYDDVKEFDGDVYTGMTVGGRHTWRYTNAIWQEVKTSPDEWEFTLTSTKERDRPAPDGSGAALDTQYHWYLLAHQFVRKIDADRYSTFMSGLKYKVAHKRPGWRGWSSGLDAEDTERVRVVAILENAVDRLRRSETSPMSAVHVSPSAFSVVGSGPRRRGPNSRPKPDCIRPTPSAPSRGPSFDG